MEPKEAAKAEFLRAQDRVTKALESTPTDKQNWSPSPSSRTPIKVAAHCALSVKGIHGWLMGEPFPFSSIDDLDKYSRSQEANFKTPEQALELLGTNSAAYIAWLDALTPEKLGETFTTPMGEFPMAFAITFSADHLRGHAAQMDYIQTIYGDRSMHM